jgi:hypothetical protein
MLIKELVCAIGATFVGRAFGFGASEPCAIGFSFTRRLLTRAALLETFQIYHFSHNRPSCSEVGESGYFGKQRVRRKIKTRTGQPGRHCLEFPSIAV